MSFRETLRLLAAFVVVAVLSALAGAFVPMLWAWP